MNEREKLGSRLGFILISAGCAIGIGNVWKFPYVAGQNGGGVFLFFYILFLLLLGIPVLTMEFAMGRAAQSSPMQMYQKLQPKKSKWHLHRWFMLAGNYLLMMFYTVVTGWMLRYFVDMASGSFVQASSEAVELHFGSLLSQPAMLLLYTFLVIGIGFGVCAIGVQKGLERITKWMMLALLAIMAVLAVNSLFLPDAAEGLKYYLYPDFSRLNEIGLWNVMQAAMNQSFFSLSIGIGAMAIFGSYIGKEHSLLKESATIAALDTFVAFVAGLIVIPACFSYGVEVGAGPSLVFLTLPNIFSHMPMGQLWGSLFFVFLSFAALSTVLAVFENIISMTMELFGWTRKQSCLYNFIAMLLLSMPCIFGFNLLSAVQPLGQGSTIMDLEDLIVSNYLLPLGSLVFVLFCTWNFGWGWDNYLKEANTGSGIKVPSWIHPYCKYILPGIILLIFILGLI